MDESIILDDEDTRVSAEEKTVPNQPTERIEYDSAQTIEQDGESTTGTTSATGEKTALLFGKEEIQKKMQEDFTEVPEVGHEEMDPDYLSSMIKSPFPNRTEEEQLKINRNFLIDAEPFKVERLMEKLKAAPKELLTGFCNLDRWIRIPQQRITLIAARPGHGKTAFMLNMILNMCQRYQKEHFLYYTYGESKQDLEIKMINISGQKPFTPMKGINTNFQRWKYELKNRDIKSLKDRTEKEIEYKGLKNFQEIAYRIHVMDTCYNIIDLIDSIEAFHRTLPVGGVFIDYLQAIRPHKTQNTLSLSRQQQMHDISDRLRELGNEKSFPVIAGVQFAAGEANTPEYDGLSVDRLKDIGDAEQLASLIIALQNYSQSTFIGSNINHNFQSTFYNNPLKKAEKMPDIFKDKHPNTVLLAKVLANQGRAKPEVELLFHKDLMKISDLEEENTPPQKNAAKA